MKNIIKLSLMAFVAASICSVNSLLAVNQAENMANQRLEHMKEKFNQGTDLSEALKGMAEKSAMNAGTLENAINYEDFMDKGTLAGVVGYLDNLSMQLLWLHGAVAEMEKRLEKLSGHSQPASAASIKAK